MTGAPRDGAIAAAGAGAARRSDARAGATCASRTRVGTAACISGLRAGAALSAR